MPRNLSSDFATGDRIVFVLNLELTSELPEGMVVASDSTGREVGDATTPR